MDEPSTNSPSDDRDSKRVYCRNCGDPVDPRAERCPTCGAGQAPRSALDSTLDAALEGGNPFVAAAASLILPGLGQLYNRELKKGLAFVVASFVAALSALVLVGFVLYPLVLVYAVYDAYRVADRQTPTVAPDGRDA